MEYLIKNKTSKNIVLLIEGGTKFLYPKNDEEKRDVLIVEEVTQQLKNLKKLKFIQITKIEEEIVENKEEEL